MVKSIIGRGETIYLKTPFSFYKIIINHSVFKTTNKGTDKTCVSLDYNYNHSSIDQPF